jgi:NAD(P)-dependent dehydrogenase (short-subunit alcohol dehydrogenase family)
MTASLAGRVAIVTGASRGIGKGISECLAAAGAAVVLADIDHEASEMAAASIHEKTKANTIALRLDVASAKGVSAVVRRTIELFGKVDILVNNAGTITMSPLLELSEDEWDRVMDVNAKGVFLMTREVAKEMIRGGTGGCIVNVSSIAGKIPLDYQAHYCASKAAVIAITKSSALELAPHGIRVNAVCPGAVDTDLYAKAVTYTAKMQNKTFEKMNEEILNGIYIGRVIQPAEIGRAVVFLCSDDAAAINGQAININGGNSGVNY